MKRIRKLMLIGLIGGLLLMSGCIKSSDSIIKESLKNKYGEDFIIHETKTLPGGFDATVSPVSNPEILFVARIQSDGTYAFDDYQKRYVDYLIREEYSQELKKFFPDAFIFVDSKFTAIDENITNINPSLQELIKNMRSGEHTEKYAHIYIYINGEIGTLREYKEEYDFFTIENEKKIKSDQMIPLMLTIYKVDGETKREIEKYFKDDLDMDSFFIEKVLKSDDFYSGITTYEKTEKDFGKPPKISIDFIYSDEGFVKEFDEYKRRRELLENATY